MVITQQQRLAPLATVAFALVGLFVAACGDSESVVATATSEGGVEGAQEVTTALLDLHDIEDLRGEFLEDFGSTRIVLLVSPT